MRSRPVHGARRQMPRWLRLLLMGLLVAFASLAYYLTFDDIFERLGWGESPAATEGATPTEP